MARPKDPMMVALKKVKRRISLRLAKARAEGRELEELRVMDREADRFWQEEVKGFRNGRLRKPAAASPRRKR